MRTLGMHKPMTYAALERALTALGFTKTELREPAALFFEHPQAQATVILPPGDPHAKAQPLDLITVRRTIVEKGIASLENYNILVTQVSRPAARQLRPEFLLQSGKPPHRPVSVKSREISQPVTKR